MAEPVIPDPASIHRIHLIAIAGVGMASLAGMLRSRGYEVTGSDQNVYPPASTLLERQGIPVLLGFGPQNLDPPPDLVIVGNAVSRTNPEVKALLEQGLPYLSMAEALRRLFLAGKRSLVVAGTHGKTTSAAMLGWVLDRAGRDPGVMVGGDVLDFGDSFRLGAGAEFVVEGDEYDTAFFDKEAKFLHYEPRGLILTSIEFDHADIYRDIEHVTAAFVKLLELVPAADPVIACADFPRVGVALERAGRDAESFGLSPAADWCVTDLRDEEGRTCFTVRFRGHTEAAVRLRLLGGMNARNALGVFALCRRLGLETGAILPGLESFRGVRRRQEVLLQTPVVVIDDFAHHPTAIAATLEAVRRRYAGRRLWAVFEPRSNTSRRRIFQEEFPRAFSGADRVVVAQVYVKETDALAPGERLSVDEVVTRLRSAGREAETLPSPDAILEHLRARATEGDVIVCMSNGAFGGLPGRLAAALRRQ